MWIRECVEIQITNRSTYCPASDSVIGENESGRVGPNLCPMYRWATVEVFNWLPCNTLDLEMKL